MIEEVTASSRRAVDLKAWSPRRRRLEHAGRTSRANGSREEGWDGQEKEADEQDWWWTAAMEQDAAWADVNWYGLGWVWMDGWRDGRARDEAMPRPVVGGGVYVGVGGSSSSLW